MRSKVFTNLQIVTSTSYGEKIVRGSHRVGRNNSESRYSFPVFFIYVAYNSETLTFTSNSLTTQTIDEYLKVLACT